MKRLIPLLCLLGACGSAPAPENNTVDWMLIAGSPSFDPASLKEGEYALYRLVIKDDGRQGQVKFRATKREGTDVWVETTYIAMNLRAVVKSKIDAKGEILETWTGVPGGDEPPKQAYLRGKDAAPAKAGPAGPKPVTAIEILKLNNRAYTCTRLVTTFTHKDGTTTAVKEWCCSEVPFSALHEKRLIGGLVLRETAKFRLEIMSHGVEAGEDLPLPK